MSVICMWSGPRNLSTAMMRSFGGRADTAVLDEPFFAPFLAVSGKDHPGRDETLAQHETDPARVADICTGPVPDEKRYYFQKHMPHHMLDGFPVDWCKDAQHFFLIREPARVICSYAKGRAAFDLDDLGYAPQRRLYDTLCDMTGAAPPILDSMDILRNPEGMLRALCSALSLPWDAGMLSWPAGPRETDGAWAPYWYGSVERSTGFSPAPEACPDIDARYADMAARAQRDYDALYGARLLPQA